MPPVRGESKWPEAGFPAKEGKNQSGAVRESGARRRVKEVEEASCGLKTARNIPQLVPSLFSLEVSGLACLLLFSGTLAPIVHLLPCPPQNNDVAA